MHGLLVVDKPSGPSSHDVVARLRRVLRETRIGHTGTLDPMATGVLLLVVGKATRLAKFLSACDKSYEAVVRFGFATDTADAMGQPIGLVHEGAAPPRAEIDAALDAFRGTFQQQPPAFSAKKIDGQRSYQLARRRGRESIADSAYSTAVDPVSTLSQKMQTTPDPLLPAPATVAAHRIDVVGLEADTVKLRLDCSAGFYVRSLAHDLGARLGIGAHLTALRRTRAGGFGLDQAVTLQTAERDPAAAAAAIIPLAGMLPGLPSVALTPEGADRVAHGQDVRPGDQLSTLNGQRHQPSASSQQPFVRLVSASGELVAVAQPAAGGLLHPSVVLV
jgi:tRNA pseudouridine55 synthase